MADEKPNGSGAPGGPPAGDRLTYEDSGVDYDRIDPLKVLAQQAARATGANLERAGAHTGVREVA
ncbi:MAG: hypothetical protein F4104_07035, partial [Gemmatimonadetes bacterium]|nr:hypothetical protein [Gemmatimonadota bacterium]